ncbi:14861_t:CDS:1 [Funneliformis geosporum]|uniref:6279_t:CDS:1 n=1 Tax=Funneliformis geosporum TaxID=1117311 RepID=A0A9W4WVE1_9GLOM|nr:14861_t:CDS:1 [Funneliformis geosporum]CAI2166493.1 6279_t:CDS:1 [Funneliformis geosporum]
MAKSKSTNSKKGTTKKIKKRSTNAFFQYRNSKIVHAQKLKMRDLSRITSTGWKSQDDLQKQPYFQAAAKDAVEKEAASGGNGITKKSYEPCGNFAFINETPIEKAPLPKEKKEKIPIDHKRVFINNKQSDVFVKPKIAKGENQRERNGLVIRNSQVQLQSGVDNPNVIKKVAIDQNISIQHPQKTKSSDDDTMIDIVEVVVPTTQKNYLAGEDDYAFNRYTNAGDFHYMPETKSSDDDPTTQIIYPSDEEDAFRKYTNAEDYYMTETKSSDDDITNDIVEGVVSNTQNIEKNNYDMPGTDFTPAIMIDGTTLPNPQSSFHDNCGDGLTETLNDCFNLETLEK